MDVIVNAVRHVFSIWDPLGEIEPSARRETLKGKSKR